MSSDNDDVTFLAVYMLIQDKNVSNVAVDGLDFMYAANAPYWCNILCGYVHLRHFLF
jgi:hypothetical protein